ncbi:endonuclease NucS domain-containing protein [Thermodesulfobacteriota bacterium]
MTIPKSYYRIMLGRKSVHAEEAYKGQFIGVDFGIDQDLSSKLPENWREFNKAFIPVFLAANPGKSKVAAGLACGAVHTVSKGIKQGDMILCPDGQSNYWVGEVVSGYSYHPGGVLPHRRQVQWYQKAIARAEMSQPLQYSTGAIGTVSNISKYAEEIEQLLGGIPSEELVAMDKDVEDPTVFALEKHLEEFLVHNWANTELGRDYMIFAEDGELVGQQYPSDTGPIDILAISKDRKELLVVELKKGRASDVVVGQIQRYMGYVVEELAEEGQGVRGIIIALEDDLRLRRALTVATNIDFYRYQVSFQLFKG